MTGQVVDDVSNHVTSHAAQNDVTETCVRQLDDGCVQLIHLCALNYVFICLHDIIRYDTIEEINVDSKAEYTA